MWRPSTSSWVTATTDTFSGGTTFDCGPDICTFDLDVVTYARRVNGVKADADGVRDDGERGEGDLIRADIEAMPDV